MNLHNKEDSGNRLRQNLFEPIWSRQPKTDWLNWWRGRVNITGRRRAETRPRDKMIANQSEPYGMYIIVRAKIIMTIMTREKRMKCRSSSSWDFIVISVVFLLPGDSGKLSAAFHFLSGGMEYRMIESKESEMLPVASRWRRPQDPSSLIKLLEGNNRQ